ncbi:hypothetical protein ACIPSE_20880 [Streptomyces sp. NPDC090106]|uniref:hypothetical protein n=1 Tax=Streptomyces sp. NPDC090106 TaxID=3365946 RepID=UPI0038066599
MEAELATLIATGATTAVGLMVTETWDQARQRLVRLFSRGGAANAADEELSRSRNALVAAAGTPDEEALTSDITALIRLRLRGVLAQDPGAATELRRLIDELAPPAGAAAPGDVRNSITGGTVHGPVVQGHTFSNLTFGAADDTASDPSE